jgi:hypothetical protein
MGRAEMGSVHDSMARGAEPSDFSQNAWAQCAVTPKPDELDSFITDFDGLPPLILRVMTKDAGAEIGDDEGYPIVPEEQIPAEVMAKVKERTKRKPLAFMTPAGMWVLSPSGGTQAFLDEQARFSAGKKGASRYEALRSLLIARAIHPAADVVAAAVEEHPGIPIALGEHLVGASAGGKVPARL